MCILNRNFKNCDGLSEVDGNKKVGQYCAGLYGQRYRGEGLEPHFVKAARAFERTFVDALKQVDYDGLVPL